MTATEKKIIKIMVALLEQNQKISKKLKNIDDKIETMAESIDTLIQIETKKFTN